MTRIASARSRLLVAAMVTAACVASTPGGAPAQAPPPADPPITGTFGLSGTDWVVEEIDGERLIDAPPSKPRSFPRASFPRTGGLKISGGCLKFEASLTGPGGQALTFAPRGATGGVQKDPRRGFKDCPRQFAQQDHRVFESARETATYRQEGDALWLLDASGVTRVRLRAAQ